VQHAVAIDVRTVQEFLRWGPPRPIPMGAHLAEVAAADAAGSDDDTLGIHGNLTACRAAADPGGAAVGDFDGADVRVEQHLQVRPVRMRLERVQQAWGTGYEIVHPVLHICDSAFTQGWRPRALFDNILFESQT